jgi:hypothetical protein
LDQKQQIDTDDVAAAPPDTSAPKKQELLYNEGQNKLMPLTTALQICS